MTLPSSGAITLNDVNIELGRTSGSAISLNDSDVRGLAGVPSGAVALSNLHGKTAKTHDLIVGHDTFGNIIYYGFGPSFINYPAGLITPSTLDTGSPFGVVSIYTIYLAGWTDNSFQDGLSMKLSVSSDLLPASVQIKFSSSLDYSVPRYFDGASYYYYLDLGYNSSLRTYLASKSGQTVQVTIKRI